MSELKCPACRCRRFAKVDEPTLDGEWDNSKLIRCVNCKRIYAAPTPDAPSAGEVTADVAIVRAVLHAHQRAMTPPDSGWGDMSYAKGSYDRLPQFQAALKAFRTAIRALPAPPQADGGDPQP